MGQKMQKRILIIEDELTLCQMLRRYFEARGYSVRILTSAQDIDAVKREIFNKDGSYAADAILSDVTMPGITGIELVRVLSNENVALPPCALMSGNWTVDDLLVAQNLGCSIFKKPFSLADVCEWLLRGGRQKCEVTPVQSPSFNLQNVLQPPVRS